MAKTGFPVEVLTPEGEVFNDEVVQISTKTSIGSLGILAKHQPMLAILDPTELRLYKDGESKATTLVQGEGYLQVQRDGRVLILVDEAGKPEDFDRSEWQERLQRAEDELSSAEADSHQAETAKRDKRRAEAVLEVLDAVGKS